LASQEPWTRFVLNGSEADFIVLRFLMKGISCAAFRGSRAAGGESGLDRSARSGLSGRDMNFFLPPSRSSIETLAA
jgi:hypothetical protein